MRILIVDDHPIVASGCRTVLADEPDIALLEASDAESGERVFVTEHPDICLIDINLPTVSGFELARRILAHDPDARIIMFSMNDDPVFVARAIEVGAKGFVSKTGDPQDLVEAIREVGKGGVYLPPAMARSMAFAGPAFARSPLSKLNSREMEILRLLSAGKSLSEIAWLVHSPYKTVANTSSIMRQKLGVRTSAELVRIGDRERRGLRWRRVTLESYVMTLQTVSLNRSYGGTQGVYRHASRETKTDMTFSVYVLRHRGWHEAASGLVSVGADLHACQCDGERRISQRLRRARPDLRCAGHQSARRRRAGRSRRIPTISAWRRLLCRRHGSAVSHAITGCGVMSPRNCRNSSLSIFPSIPAGNPSWGTPWAVTAR